VRTEKELGKAIQTTSLMDVAEDPSGEGLLSGGIRGGRRGGQWRNTLGRLFVGNRMSVVVTEPLARFCLGIYSRGDPRSIQGEREGELASPLGGGV